MGISEVSRMRRAISSTVRSVVPARSARSAPRWITGPSAIGSENGTPSSIRSQPPRSSAATSSGVCSGVGSPAVMYATSPVRSCALRESKSRAIRVWLIEVLHVLAIDVRVFVAAAGEVHDENAALLGRRTAQSFSDSVRRFQCRNDSFGAGKRTRGRKRVGIGGIDVLRAPAVPKPGVLRPHQRVIETGGNRVGGRHLAVLVLKQPAVRPMQHARRSGGKTRRVF